MFVTNRLQRHVQKNLLEFTSGKNILVVKEKNIPRKNVIADGWRESERRIFAASRRIRVDGSASMRHGRFSRNFLDGETELPGSLCDAGEKEPGKFNSCSLYLIIFYIGF